MNEEKMLYHVSGAPFVRSKTDTQRIMLDVLIALLPAFCVSVWQFGVQAIIRVVVSVASCVFFEWAYRKLMKKDSTIHDLSACVTGVLMVFCMPSSVPLWMIVWAALFAIVLVKQLFGGIGKNFLNPALAGRAVLLASYAGTMTSWVDPAAGKAAIIGSNADVVTTATPLAIMKTGDFAELMATYGVDKMFIGQIPGSLGEVSAVALLIGGAYLIWRKVINWQTPVAYIATVAVLTFLFPKQGTGLEWMLYSVFGGGLFLGAFFMATDYATSPVTKKGQLIFGIGCGLFTVLIRYFGSYNEGVCYSIMVMNLCVALIDKYTKPTRFGVVKSDKKEAAAK